MQVIIRKYHKTSMSLKGNGNIGQYENSFKTNVTQIAIYKEKLKVI